MHKTNWKDTCVPSIRTGPAGEPSVDSASEEEVAVVAAGTRTAGRRMMVVAETEKRTGGINGTVGGERRSGRNTFGGHKG